MKRLSFFLNLLIGIALYAQMNPSNHDITVQAMTYNNVYGNQCKIFLQTVMTDLQYPVGAGYRNCYLDIGYEVTANEALAGDVIQIYNNAATNDSFYYAGYHTSIILENNGDGTFRCIDSNWGLDEMVQIHTWNPVTYATNNSNGEYTLTAHYYRLGHIAGFFVNGWNPNPS